MSAPKSDLVFLGVVTGARGLKGEVRLKSYTSDPARIGDYGPLTDADGRQSFNLRVTGVAKDRIFARIDGVDDRDAAEALKGLALHVPRDALPDPDEDEYYLADLVGLRAEISGGPGDEILGTVKAVHDFGAGPVLEISDGEADDILIPFTRAAVPVVDIARGRLLVESSPGPAEPADAGGVKG
jgi:16S rRNA processing protein RimM